VNELELTSLLGRHASAHSVPGAAIGILREGEVITACSGFADLTTGEPVTADTRFAIGSLGKSIVATAVARLSADGRLGLDDPVAAHVPELRNASWGESITVRDLLANRSRLPLRAELEFSGFGGDEDDGLSRLATEIATGEPTASFWSYTNAGWCLLGRAIETLTGLTWEDAMHANLLAPLGMDQTTFANWPIAEPRAASYDITTDGPRPAEPWTPRALGPAGSTLLSTVTDLLRFATSHLDDPTLAILRATHADVRIHAWLDAWCLGWARFDWEGGPVWGWDGVISGHRAILRILPEHRAAVVLLTNGSNGRAMYRSLFTDLMAAWFDIGVPRLRLEPLYGTAGDLSRFVGVYAWPDRRVEVTATDDGLIVESELGKIEALPIDAASFLLDADDPDTPTMTFGAFDDSGRPGALYEMLWGLPRV
jgi:CubicO group peptidase (beta-lactamase class C family)